MNLRPLCSDDIDFMIYAREFFPDGWNKDMIVSAFRAGKFYGFVAEEAGKPLGFITYSFAGEFADLNDLFVMPEHRKKGIAKSLLKTFVSDAAFKGAQKLFLEVRKSNSAAVALYRLAGFEKISVRKGYYADGEDAEVYMKEILK